ncbi:MAG TPA: 3-phosphoglycerate dehydrogenase, partial [Myxococcales bacterium]|nr:3-phosphoglycerate dehydrogenase [Myxococcales bacterium]
MAKKVLLATEKPFAASARDQVVSIIKEAGYEAVVLESYTSKADPIRSVADVDAMIVRSDIVDAEILAAAKNLKLVVRA